jgi:CPA2 family monovalent cation:H+ antiporter-2
MDGFDILLPTVLLLATGFFVIYICRLVRISPIVGFLLAGVALGPNGLQVIADGHTTHFLAELGIVFLLFDIGLHFSYKSAWSLRRDLLGLAPLQLMLSGLVLGMTIAVVFSVSSEIALLVGLTLALSSTAVVMQMIAELKQTESPVSHSAKSVLIFQDLAAIFLLIYADTVGGGDTMGVVITGALFKTVLAFGAAVVLGQYVLSPLMRSIIRYDDPEMFTILGLLIVMMTSLATATAGLSLTLGAFLAGMVLAETPFRVLLQTELRPFRSLLMAFFFITIGMLLNPLTIWQEAGTILSMTALLMAAKGAIIGALVFVMKRPLHHVIQLTFLLAQGSEFAFVIFTIAAINTALGPALSEQLIAAVALSMLLTPVLSLLAHRWSLNICDTYKDASICNCPGDETNPRHAESQPIFIIGMNEVGKTLARAFKAHRIPYLAVDNDRQRFLEATAAGYTVAYGQTSDLRFWNTLDVKRASAICVAVPKYETAQRLSPIIKRLYPELKRYVAVNDSADGVRFAALGMTPFHNRGAPPGLEMAHKVLLDMGVDEKRITEWMDDEQSAYLDSNKSSLSDELLTAMAAE